MAKGGKLTGGKGEEEESPDLPMVRVMRKAGMPKNSGPDILGFASSHWLSKGCVCRGIK